MDGRIRTPAGGRPVDGLRGGGVEGGDAAVTIPPLPVASGARAGGAAAAGKRRLERARVLAPIRDVPDHRVRAAQENPPQPLGALVVEDPLPPARRDVL